MWLNRNAKETVDKSVHRWTQPTVRDNNNIAMLKLSFLIKALFIVLLFAFMPQHPNI